MDYYVYFIKRDGGNDLSPTKIGVSTNIEKRIKALQTASPMKLSVRAAIKCDSKSDAYTLERCFHFIAARRFQKLQGEWFIIRGSWKKLIQQALKMAHVEGEKVPRKEVLNMNS